MPSYRRVLVALDGSTACEAVLRFLMDIAGPLDMTVMLLHVLEPITPSVIDGTVVSTTSRPVGRKPRSIWRPSRLRYGRRT